MPVTMAIDALCGDLPVPPHAVKRTTDATITIALTSEYRLFITSPHDYIPQTFIRRGVVVSLISSDSRGSTTITLQILTYFIFYYIMSDHNARPRLSCSGCFLLHRR